MYIDNCDEPSNDWVYGSNSDYNRWFDIYKNLYHHRHHSRIETFLRLLEKRPIFIDQYQATTGKSYPICSSSSLLSLNNIVNDDMNNNDKLIKYYNMLLHNDTLHCGRTRVGNVYDNLFHKKHYIQWKGCSSGIVMAKKRLMNYINDLCHYQQDIVDISNIIIDMSNVSSSTSSNSNSNSNSDNGNDINSNNRNKLIEAYNQLPRRRGIVYTGKSSHLKNIYQSILAHRMLNVTLSIEVWVISNDYNMCMKTVKLLYNVDCYKLPNHIIGFASKYHALLSTKLTDVIFMDADNIAIKDVNIIFDSDAYKKYGLILWPDLWGDRCRPIVSHFQEGYTAYKTHVLWTAEFGGLKWEKKREIAQEAEAGQIAIDVRRHGGLLEVGRQFIEDKFLMQVVNGDKDIFRIVSLIFQQPFYFVPHIPSYSVNKMNQRDCLVHYFKGGDIDLDGTAYVEPFFFHQLKIRDPDAMRQAYRLPISSRSSYSSCADLRLISDNNNNNNDNLDEEDSSILPFLVLEKIPKGDDYYIFITNLYNRVDKAWDSITNDNHNYWLFLYEHLTKVLHIKFILPCIRI